MRRDLDTTALADWDSLGVTVKVCVLVMRGAIFLKLISKSAAEAPQSGSEHSRTELMSFRFTRLVIRRDRHTSRENIYSRNHY